MPAPTTCAVCNEEVRWGERGGRTAWWHRDDQTNPATGYLDDRIGHEPVLGTASFQTDWAAVERQMAAYAESNDEDERTFDIPAPDIWAHEITWDQEIMPGGAKNLIKAAHKAGGRTLATHSRGPRVHGSHGNLLGMSDYVMVKFNVDGRRSVALWVDGKLDIAYILHYGDDHLITPEPTSSKGIRAHFKPPEEAPDGTST